MISKFMAALVIAAAGLFAGLFAGMAAPASAACAPGLTSIPCTIADNVSNAPSATIISLSQAPSTLAGVGCAQPNDPNPSGNASNCGLPSITNLAGVGCPPDGDGNSTEPCGLPAVPGTFASSIAGLPGQFALGANQIATAPQTIAGNLLAAPGVLANSLTHGGTYTPPAAPPTNNTPSTPSTPSTP